MRASASLETLRVHVLGAGIIGLACAEELLRRGHDVVVHDPAPGRGASYAAAGMLSPSAEVWHGEPEVLDLGLRSLALWPAYAARLGIALPRAGTLLVGLDHADRQEVARHAALLANLAQPVEELDPVGVAAREPAVSARVAGGAWLPGDAAVDPRSVLAALRDRVPVVTGRPEGGAEATILATGSRLPAPFSGLVRGVRGEILRARMTDPPRVVVRGWARGVPVYVVPRTGGEVVVGATSEEHDAEPVVTLGGLHALLDAGRALVPGLDRAELLEATARDRPATPDHLPLVGPAGVDGVVLAAGHFRHGVLLAPLTARLVADHLETGCVEPALDPRRFTHTPEPAGSRPC